MRSEAWDAFSWAAQESIYYQPLALPGRALGVVQLVDPQSLQPDMLRLVVNRMVTEIDKALVIEQSRQDKERKDHLISILGQIGATLDPDEVLRLLIDYGRQVINAEACSLFLVDEDQGDIVLHLSTNLDENPSLGKVRVPKGKGIIGHVVETGERVLVSDVANDQRHFRGVDQTTGFITRAILTVPLRAASINQGERGISQERIIGGLQALNKLEGTFDEQDAETLSTLAMHAATVFRMARIVADNDQLSMDMIQWMIAAIDARDPYTEGHSKRVSDYSVEISRQLNLPPETIYQVRIGSLLHDIGKIGVPDAILRKPERLTSDEYELMKQHPIIGARMMSQVHSLQHVLPALAEHHERLDGKGYPRSLKGAEVSLFGRIVAVADVFDAMTSKRPYRDGSPAEEVLDYLYSRVNTEFDSVCVDALTRAYLNGTIKTQRERDVEGGA
jgi:putative nucleotidyltransferase with HDIG domain